MNAELEPNSSRQSPESRKQNDDFSLAPTNRLPNQAAYQRVFKRGKRTKTAHFVGHVLAASTTDRRLGLAISKKAWRKAVERNLVKRLVREYFRQHKMLVAAGDYIIVARTGAAKINRRELTAELAKLFSTLTLLATEK